ncbi:MAG: ABC transporter ATP-binding protein [Clostridiales bacterium]|nr:ABC transporter ATP-binding protein [Candidatus Blautia equi]
MLASNAVTKKFLRKTAVDSVSISLEKGRVYALLGPNGSGKTTWMKMAAGLLLPTSGTMTYKGKPIGIESKKEIAYMSTEPYFYNWMTVKDVGKYYQDFFADFSMDRFQELIARMDLTNDLKTKALSSGMMAKLKIAVTMARKAKVYLLDEPLNGIDLLARDEIMKTIRESIDGEAIILLSTHLVDELEDVVDDVIFMKNSVMVGQWTVDDLHNNLQTSVADKYRQIYGM